MDFDDIELEIGETGAEDSLPESSKKTSEVKG